MQFLCLVELPGGTAPEIVDTLLNVFTPRKISLDELCGIATDGASVMVGCRTGVTTQLKDKNPYLLSIQCIAHCLALASGQGADSVPYIKQYQSYANICKYFHYSTTHMHKLTEISKNGNFTKYFIHIGCHLRVLFRQLLHRLIHSTLF